jgi:hypothetical protein
MASNQVQNITDALSVATLATYLETSIENVAAGVIAPPTASGGVVHAVTQAAHGFLVGEALRLSGSAYVRAQANNAVNAEVVGIVSEVVNAGEFKITTGGRITGLAGLTAGEPYFLSATTAGLLTLTPPATIGQIRKALLLADTATSGFFVNFTGIEMQQGINDQAIGVSQTWQDVTASRAQGVTYTNTTGKPIFVSVQAANGLFAKFIRVNGVAVAGFVPTSSGNLTSTCCAIVQNGSTYSVDNFATLALWVELR